MWSGAIAMQGIGINRKDIRAFVEYMLKNGTAEEKENCLSYMKSDMEIDSPSGIDNPEISLSSFLLESNYLFATTLGKLGLTLHTYPHDLRDRYEENTVGVIGHDICTLYSGDEPPVTAEPDEETLKENLAVIFGKKRIRTSPLKDETEFLITKGYFSYYSFPADCMCCT